jgi:hypothetical protein
VKARLLLKKPMNQEIIDRLWAILSRPPWSDDDLAE